MKDFRLLRFTLTVIAVISFFGIASADSNVAVRDGHVYRIVNASDSRAMKSNTNGEITVAASNAADQSQLWLAEAQGEGCYMRSLADGHYITSPRARAQVWKTQYAIEPVSESMLLRFVPDNGQWYIHTVEDYGKADDRDTNGYAIVNSYSKVAGGVSTNASSHWDIVEVDDITADQIAGYKAGWKRCVSDIVAGAPYRIHNFQYGLAMVPGNNNSLVCATSTVDDENQVWIAEANPEGEGYLLRHYATGMVMTSPCLRNQLWTVSDGYAPSQETSVFYFNKKQSGFGISTVSTRGLADEASDFTYAQENPGRNVICGAISSNQSLWLFTPADEISQADIEAKMLTWDSYKQKSLETAIATLFTDGACTELTPEYAAMSTEALAADKNVQALPEALRTMVLKIRSGDWSETSARNGMEWDSAHARKMRVQMVEPFSECTTAATLAGIQAYTNLNNPTGIISDNGDVLYVMVDKDPAEGATLYIAGRTGEGLPLGTLNNATDGFKLKKGLNIVPCNKDLADMIVYYTVTTTDGKTRMHSVTDYEDIKIHIEGGTLNGYFNSVGDALYTPDTNEDWLYSRERAMHPMFTLLSRYVTLYMHFDDITADNGAVTKCLKSLCSPEAYTSGLYDLCNTMKAWDDMYIAETLIMGLQTPEVINAEKGAGRDYYDTLSGDRTARDDYYKYFNNRLMGISMRDCGFMNATSYRTAYNPSTISSIIREFPTGDLWGPAHEFGHLNQQPMKIAGTTEESNNVFSNVALFYRGRSTSRADYPSEQRRRFNEGQTFLQHSTWGTTRMWFQLWLYYHYAGHDKRFYPRLYELLRNDPLKRTTAPGHDGVINPILAKDDLLHFAKMACVAAGEDLTDFFEAWGFFVEQDGFYIDDYAQYTSYLSAEDIAEWKADIARMATENNWKKNSAIIFIDDRVGSDRPSHSSYDKTKCGSMGGLKDFTQGAPVTGEYTYTVTGTTVKVTGGQGGAGFLLRDNDGTLIGFANEPDFEISPAAAEKISKGEATFMVVTPDSEESAVANVMQTGSFDERLALLDALIAKSAELIAKADSECRKVGYFKPEIMSSLAGQYGDIKDKRDNGGITADNILALYNSLNVEYLTVCGIQPDEDTTIGIIPGGIYVFTSNMLYNGKGITANADGTLLANVKAEDVDMDDTAQQWIFEPTTRDEYYYIRNVKFDKYIGKAPADETVVTLVDEPMMQYVALREFGAISVSPLGSDHDSLHDNGRGKLTRWDSNGKASRWTITLIGDWQQRCMLAELAELIAKAEALLAQAGTVSQTPSGTVGEPSADYRYVTGEMLVTLHNHITDGKALSGAATMPEADEIRSVSDRITAAHDTLLEAMNRDTESSLDSITVSEADMLDNAVIYTLGGHRITTITTPGIYIINGRKIMVR